MTHRLLFVLFSFSNTGLDQQSVVVFINILICRTAHISNCLRIVDFYAER